MPKRITNVASIAAAALSLSGCASFLDAGPADGGGVEERRSRFFTESRPPVPAPEAEAALWSSRQASLEEYTVHGLRHSARLQAAFEEWAAAAQRPAQVAALPEPRFTYAEFIEEIETRTGPQNRRFGVAQAFPWPGKLDAAAGVAELAAEALWERVEGARLGVVRDIELAFHEYAFLGRELSINAQLLALLQSLEPAVQSRVRAGAGQQDLLRLQVEIGRLENEAARLERRRPVLSARLGDAMTLSPEQGLLPLPELQEPETRGVDVAAALENALKNNPHLRALARELEGRQAREELAGYERRPSFSLGVDYFQTGRAATQVSGSGDDPVAVGLSVSLPVWGESYAAAEREARHGVRAARLRIDAAESALRAELEEQAFLVDDAARRITLYRDSLLPRAEEALRLTTSSYRTGAASLLDLIDAERVLLEFELSLWRACLEYRQGEARWRALIGAAGERGEGR